MYTIPNKFDRCFVMLGSEMPNSLIFANSVSALGLVKLERGVFEYRVAFARVSVAAKPQKQEIWLIIVFSSGVRLQDCGGCTIAIISVQ